MICCVDFGIIVWIIGGTKEKMENNNSENKQNLRYGQVSNNNNFFVNNMQQNPISRKSNYNSYVNHNFNVNQNVQQGPVSRNSVEYVENTDKKVSISILFNVLAVIVFVSYFIYTFMDVSSLNKFKYILRNLLLDLSHAIFYSGVLLGIGQLCEKSRLK